MPFAESAEWPVQLSGEWDEHAIVLRRLRPHRDRQEWLDLRRRNRDWTGPWDSTSPVPTARYPFATMVRRQEREARAGRLRPFAVERDGRLVGQVHLFGISRGSLLGAAAGYWIDRDLAGSGVTPYALAMVLDHAFGSMGLHRVEVNIRPDNAASLRVVAKLGMRDEGVRARYLHIAGQWHDHRTFALTTEDVADGPVVDRLRARDRPGNGPNST